MSKFATYLGAALVSCFAASAHAGTGDELLSHCQSAEKWLDDQARINEKSAYCLGVVEGVKNTLTILKAQTGNQTMGCLPATLKNGQAIRIVLKYLREKPENLHQDGTVLTMVALVNAYPCK